MKHITQRNLLSPHKNILGVDFGWYSLIYFSWGCIWQHVNSIKRGNEMSCVCERFKSLKGRNYSVNLWMVKVALFKGAKNKDNVWFCVQCFTVCIKFDDYNNHLTSMYEDCKILTNYLVNSLVVWKWSINIVLAYKGCI